MPFSPQSWTGTKALKPDFFFSGHNAILEIAQNTNPNRGVRRESYVSRNEIKEKQYQAVPDLDYRFVDSDPFFKYTGFDIAGWIKTVATALCEMGVDIGPMPDDYSSLRYEDCTDKIFFLSTPTENLIDHLINTLKVRGVGDFINKHSTIKNLVAARQDYAEILAALKKLGCARRSVAASRFSHQRQVCYASLHVVREFLRSRGIRTQKQWVAYAKANRAELKANNIPSSLREIYMRLGVWSSWRDVLLR